MLIHSALSSTIGFTWKFTCATTKFDTLNRVAMRLNGHVGLDGAVDPRHAVDLEGSHVSLIVLRFEAL